MNNRDKNFECLEKQIALWSEIVKETPALKYDLSSDLSNQILNTLQEYQMELKKRDESIPDDFPLKDFLQYSDGV